MQDSDILNGLRQANPEALRHAVLKYTAYVGTVICNTGRGRLAFADTEELASDVFLALWQNAARVLALKAYLGRCARNKTLNFLRGLRETLPLNESNLASLPQDETADAAMDEEMLAAALARLRPAEREVLTRHYYQNEKVAQIACAMGLSESAVKQRLVRGRESLRREMTNS